MFDTAQLTTTRQKRLDPMSKPIKNGLTTTIVHRDRRVGTEYGAMRAPISVSSQYGFDKVETLIGVFQGTVKGSFSYSRQATPTNAMLEAKINELEGGVGTICFATGMAAVTAVFLSLLKAGDHVISSLHIFGNTNSLLDTLKQFGIEVSMVDMSSTCAVADALKPTTKMVFTETIANPGTQIADLANIGAFCKEQDLVYVVDNTITSPALFKPVNAGASLVINSLSKIMSGHGAALGGSVTDTGLYDWSAYPNIADSYRKVPATQQGLLQIRKKALRDMGASLSSEHANQISMGMETLALRVRQSSETAQVLAEYLNTHPAVASVLYPGLEGHPQHELAQELFGSGAWLLSVELKDASQVNPFLNALTIPIKATGLGDARTLVIPMASTIFWEAGPEKRREMGITDGLIRVSIGLEEAEDLLEDFANALALIQ
jgi:O-acetylhomoserine (thiol)-lyase